MRLKRNQRRPLLHSERLVERGKVVKVMEMGGTWRDCEMLFKVVGVGGC